MKLLLKELNTPFLPYDPKCDPTRQPLSEKETWQEEFTKREWTLGPRAVSTTRKRLSHSEAKAEPKPKKVKEKSQEKASPSQLSSSDNSAGRGEGSKQLEMTDPIKVKPEDEYDGVEEQKQNDCVINELIMEKNLKQESIHMESENGDIQFTTTS